MLLILQDLISAPPPSRPYLIFGFLATAGASGASPLGVSESCMQTGGCRPLNPRKGIPGGQGGIGIYEDHPTPPIQSYRLVGVRHNGRGKRSVAPGSGLEPNADRGLPPPEPPQGDTRWAGGIGVR